MKIGICKNRRSNILIKIVNVGIHLKVFSEPSFVNTVWVRKKEAGLYVDGCVELLIWWKKRQFQHINRSYVIWRRTSIQQIIKCKRGFVIKNFIYEIWNWTVFIEYLKLVTTGHRFGKRFIKERACLWQSWRITLMLPNDDDDDKLSFMNLLFALLML